MVRDRAAYDASTINWDRLRGFAKRVARETTVPPNSPLTQPASEQRTVTQNVEVKGFLGFGRRIEQRTTTHLARFDQEVVGAHWTLDSRRWIREMSSRSRNGTHVDTNRSWMHLVLLPDGKLLYVTLNEEEVEQNNRRVFMGHTHTVAPADEAHITALDFARSYHSHKSTYDGVRTYVETDRERDEKWLLRHAKGVGVHLLLKDLVEGRQPNYSRLTAKPSRSR